MNRTSAEISAGSRDVQIAAELQPIALRSMFWRPAWLEASAWQEHIPFAFWLVEAHRPRVVVELGTHHGTSYFALCQAVDRLGLDTRCFAVDTWKSDEHAGRYGDSVYETVRAYNDAQYSGFSRLVRSSFDDALRHFSDGTVDLLHIDGLHTIEAVTHDFESWLPKLSDRAVVIFHGTNVRERGFGVYQIFERLKQQYPAFEFVHGHGLGVLGIGEHQTPMLKRMFESDGRGEVQRSIQEVFSRLGRSCADAYAAQRQQAERSQLQSELQQYKENLDEMSKVLAQTREQLKAKSGQVASLQEIQEQHVELYALERGQLAERATMLLEAKFELKEQVSRLQSQIDAMREQALPDPASSIEHLNSLHATHAQEIGRYKADLQQSAEKSAEDKERHNREKNELQEQLARLSDYRETHRREKEDMVARLQAKEAELTHFRSDVGQDKAERDALCDAHAQELDALNAELMSAKSLNAELVEKHRHDFEALTEAKRRAEASVQARFAETAELTKQLFEHQKMIADRDEAALALHHQLDAQAQQMVAISSELASAKSQLIESSNASEVLRRDLDTQVRSIESSRVWRLIALIRRTRGRGRNRVLDKKASADHSKVLDECPVDAVQSEQIRMIQHSGLFDSDWYRQRYPDVARAGINPVDHYLLHGASESRDPGPAFSTAGYLADYPDVACGGVNPLVHYLAFGRAEGRVAQRSE